MLELSSTNLTDSLSQSVNVNITDSRGRTALSWCAQRGDIDSVRFLLANGADTNLDNYEGCSPLAWAARGGHRDVAEWLLCRSSGTEINARRNGTWAAIHRLAVRWQDVQFLRLLVQHGADINAPDSEGSTPLMLAVEHHKPVTALQLIDMGCRLDLQDKFGYNALSYALMINLHSVTRELVRRGADHTTELAEDGTFLHLAAADADLETLRILTNAKLATRDIYLKRRDGLTAADVARQRKGVGRQWREAFRAFLISVTEIRVFGPEEAWSDSEDDVFEEAVEHQ